MHSSYLLLSLVPFVSACVSPGSEPCASALSASAASAAAFCATYTKTSHTATTGLPAFATACSNLPKKLSSACSCLSVATTLTTSVKTTTTTVVQTTTTSKGAVSSTTTSASKTTTAAVTTSPPAGSACTASVYAQITSVVASCTNIVLDNISVPASSTMLLNKLKAGTTVTFAGKTTFGTTKNNDFDPIVVSGTGITITGAPGHVIDGNGPVYWDGLGSNGGSAKPDHFFVVKNVVNGVVSNLNIKNWPVHCFSVTGADGLLMTGITLDNSDGFAPNSASGSLAAAHNSDGFDFSSSNNVVLSNSVVTNQDDCVAVTSGNNVTVTGMTCTGGHGLSIGSVGGKSNNVVTGITFSNSVVKDSENGIRIKTNSGTTGTVSDITYSNIKLSGITKYGLDIQQDYLNGGPTGSPTNGVSISNIIITGVTGTVASSAYDYYILCGSGSCSNFKFTNVAITGGGKASTCNYPASGCPS